MGQKMKKYNVNHRIIYLGAAVAAILAVIQSQIDVLPQALGIILYVLAAAFLAAACVCVYRDLRKGIIGRLLDRVKRTDLGGRFLEDYSFRTVLTTVPGVGINVVYTVYNGVIGVMNRSAWFITMTVYYSLLGIMRYRAVSMERKKSRMEDPEMIRKQELSVMKTDGILLLVLNLALSGIVLLTIAKGHSRKYPEIIAISVAAYTFYKITMAVVNMVKVRKLQSPVLVTIRNIGVADALVSVLTLQTTMIASFQKTDGMDGAWMNGITGLAVCLLVAALGVSMICSAYRENRNC